jgi:hypothetical protein
MSWTELEASGYIHDDCLTIRAVVTVINESKLSETRATGSEIEVPRGEERCALEGCAYFYP